MDDRRSQFLIIVGDICIRAANARLPVVFELADGSRCSGVPTIETSHASADGDEVDDTGLTDAVHVDGSRVGLLDIRRCSLDDPGE